MPASSCAAACILLDSSRLVVPPSPEEGGGCLRQLRGFYSIMMESPRAVAEACVLAARVEKMVGF